MSNKLDLDQLSPTQSSKEATINTAIGQLADALSDDLPIDMTAGATTISEANYIRHLGFVLTNAPADNTVLTLPASIQKMSMIINNCAHSVNVTRGSTVVTVPAGGTNIIYTDETANGVFLGIGVAGPVPLKPIANWATAQAYVEGPPADFVYDGGNAYGCLINHTSGTFATDLAAGKWGLIANGGANGTNGTNGTNGIAPWASPQAAWVTGTAYAAGPPANVVTQGGSAYVCLTAHTSGTFATDLAAGKWLLLAQRGDDGTPVNFSALNDVVITSVSDKQFLRWDAATSKWVNFTFGNVNTQTASYTLVLADDQSYVRMNVGSANNCTVPPSSSVAFPIGAIIEVSQVGTGVTTIIAGAGVTINDVSALGLALGAQYLFGTLRQVGTDTWDWTEGASGAGGASALSGLSDVVLTSPATADVLQYNGTKWINGPQSGGGAGGSGELGWNNPSKTTFTGLNDTGTATIVADTTWGFSVISDGSDTSGGHQLIGVEQSLPASHKWRATARLRSLFPVIGNYALTPGMYLRDSSSGHASLFGQSIFLSGIGHYDYSNPATLVNNGVIRLTWATEYWFRISYDLTHLKLWISANGVDWGTLSNILYSFGNAPFYPTSADKVGVAIDSHNNGDGFAVGLECMYWLLEDLGT